MSSPKHAEALFRIAQRDLKAARGMLDCEIFEDPVFGFQIQQCLEKLLKAWLSLKGIVYSKTHDLESLADLLTNANVQIPDNIEILLSDMTTYAVTMRYLDTPFLDEPIDRIELLNTVEAFVRRFSEILEEEGKGRFHE